MNVQEISPQEQVAQRVRSLRLERHLEKARAAIDVAKLDVLESIDAKVAAAIYVESALIHGEYAEHAAAAEDYAQAAALTGDPWSRAAHYVSRAHAACLEEQKTHDDRYGIDPTTVAPVADDLPAIEAELADELSKATLPRHAALLWAQAAIWAGVGPDDRPSGKRLDDAGDAIQSARELAPKAARPLITELRVKRSELRGATDLDEVREVAGELVEHARSVKDATGSPWSYQAAVEYEAARIALAAREWRAAEKCLRRALKHDAGHQAANVWLVYCQRILGRDDKALVGRIARLLGEGGRVPVVYEPTLVGELYTERATLLEDSEVEQAKRDYRAAIALRPTMWYARRGLMRTLTLLGRPIAAAQEGDRALKLAEELNVNAADLLVERGRVAAELSQHDKATEFFERADEAQPGYLYGYQAHMAMLRGLERMDEAIEVGQGALASDAVNAARSGGIQTELGDARLALLEYDRALECFRTALRGDDAADVGERARVGAATAHRLRRKLRDAHNELEHKQPTAGDLQALGWIRGEIGDYGGALTCFEQASVKRPHNPVLIASLARALRQLGRTHGALTLIEERLGDVPKLRRARLLNEAGWIHLDLRDHETALDHFVRARKLNPMLPAALRGQMVAEWRAKPTREALDRGIALATDPPQGPRPADVVAAMHNEAGLCCLREGDLASAQGYFAAALEVAGSDRPELRELLLVMQANGFLGADALPHAGARIDDVEVTGPELRDHPRSTLLRARWRHAIGDDDGALELFRRALEVWPESGHALMGMAAVQFGMREYRLAEERLEAVRTAAPTNVWALEMLAWTLVRRHEQESPDDPENQTRLNRAGALADEVLALEPRRPGAYECLGVIALLRSQHAAADAYMHQAVAADDTRAEVHRNHAAVHLKLANYDEALESLGLALGCRGPQHATRLLLGFACTESGREAEAIAHLRQAIALDPSEPLAPDLLASLLERRCDLDGAYAVLTRAIKTVPHRDGARVHLGRSRVLCAQAAAKDAKSERQALLGEALGEVDHALRIAEARPPGERRRSQAAADAHYHRGVVLHRRGMQRAAGRAFNQAHTEDPTHEAAARAAALLEETGRDDERDDARVANWGSALAALAIFAAVGAIAMEFAQGGWKASQFEFFPLAWVLAGAALTVLLGASLPRLAGLNLGGQVEVRITAPRAPEPVVVALSFERRDSLPATMMAGPGAMPEPDLPYDAEGQTA